MLTYSYIVHTILLHHYPATQGFSTFRTVGLDKIFFKIFGPAEKKIGQLSLVQTPKSLSKYTGDKDYLTPILSFVFFEVGSRKAKLLYHDLHFRPQPNPSAS